jgi:cytochrome b subunit of formate dehydrogenase
MDSAQRGSGPYVWRFNLYHRLTHALVIVSFFMLVISGLPLRFSCAPWAPALVKLLGGVHTAGLIHRTGALITFGYFAAHLGYLLYTFIKAKNKLSMFWGPDSMVPQPRDAVDFYKQVKWFLGLGPRPQFARFSYMEKFDYMAVFWGVAMIGGSGLMLWFPTFFGRFVPGSFFNIAAVIHSDEALLATAFIFTIHFFNVHLRPEKFPLDAVMFTGRATVHYMEEEHPVVMSSVATHLHEAPDLRQIPDTPAPPPTQRQSVYAAVFGFISLAIGLALIGMTLWVAVC